MKKVVPLEGFGGGGGSTPLNFEIVGSTTQPENPKENTIWVNTDVKISNWMFEVDEPIEKENGMVWIKTTTSSAIEFNVLNDNNGIKVYPLYAKQYINGSWVDVESEGYQNGEWKGLGEYLFNYGKQPYKWVASNLPSYVSSNNGGVTPSISTNEDGSITITTNDGGSANNQVTYGSGIYRVYDTIDFTNFKTITIDTEISGTAASWSLTIYPTSAAAWGAAGYKNGASVALLGLPSGNYTGTLDVSSISGKYYIGVGAWCDDYRMSYCKLNTLYMR